MNARNELLKQIAQTIIVDVCCDRGAVTSESAIKAAGEIMEFIDENPQLVRDALK